MKTRLEKDNLSRWFPYMENSHLADPTGNKSLKPVVALVVMFSKLNQAPWKNAGTTITESIHP